MKITATKGWEAVQQVATAIFGKSKFTKAESKEGAAFIKKIENREALEKKLLRAGFKWGYNGRATGHPEARCLMKKFGRRHYAEVVQVWFESPTTAPVTGAAAMVRTSYFQWNIWGVTPPAWWSDAAAEA